MFPRHLSPSVLFLISLSILSDQRYDDDANIVRSPDAAKIKDKMVTASSRDAIRRALVGIAVEIQGTAYDEVAYETGRLVPFIV